jgi:hypothetical protein
MSDVQLILLILIGKVCIYTIQKFPLTEKLIQKIKIETLNQFFVKLVACDFCLGVWVYFFLSLVLRLVLFKSLFYFPVISELATGAMISLAVHLFSIGFQEMFGTLVVGQ